MIVSILMDQSQFKSVRNRKPRLVFHSGEPTQCQVNLFNQLIIGLSLGPGLGPGLGHRHHHQSRINLIPYDLDPRILICTSVLSKCS